MENIGAEGRNEEEQVGLCGTMQVVFEDEDMSERERLEDLQDSVLDILFAIDDVLSHEELLKKHNVIDQGIIDELKHMFDRLKDVCEKLDRIIKEKCKEETGGEEC